MGHFRNYSRLVAFPHSVFALPFALASFVLAYRRGPFALPNLALWQILAVMIGAVVAARTAAMAFNRIVDTDIDRSNPRTASREIPAGVVSTRAAVLLCAVSAALFVSFSAILGRHCLFLSPVVLGVLLGYSLVKRVSSAAHLVLGLALALAPGGAWWVVRPTIEATPLWLMGAVLCWVGGFDVLYSCQDVQFDRSKGLFSIPARFGIEHALGLAVLLHVAALCGFLLVGVSASLSLGYYLGMLALGGVLLGQHLLVTPTDLSRLNRAFFTFNGFVSLAYLLTVLAST